jgi:hypothetical protein
MGLDTPKHARKASMDGVWEHAQAEDLHVLTPSPSV